MQATHWYHTAVAFVASLGPSALVLTQSGVPLLVRVGVCVGGAAAFAVSLKMMWLDSPSEVTKP